MSEASLVLPFHFQCGRAHAGHCILPLSIIVVGNIIVIIVLIMIISIALIINALLLFRLDHCSEEGEHILPLKFAQDRLFIVVLILSSSTGKRGHSHLFAFVDLIDGSFYAEPKRP